jgi:hypothetical protein
MEMEKAALAQTEPLDQRREDGRQDHEGTIHHEDEFRYVLQLYL